MRVEIRTEFGRINCWGIYSVKHDIWLDVIFSSKRSAKEALQVLLGNA